MTLESGSGRSRSNSAIRSATKVQDTIHLPQTFQARASKSAFCFCKGNIITQLSIRHRHTGPAVKKSSGFHSIFTRDGIGYRQAGSESFGEPDSVFHGHPPPPAYGTFLVNSTPNAAAVRSVSPPSNAGKLRVV